MDSRDLFLTKLKAQLDAWNMELAQWEAWAHQAQIDQQQAFHAHLVSLRQHRDDVQQRLVLIEQATGDAWQELAQGMDGARACISIAFAQARAHLDQLKTR